MMRKIIMLLAIRLAYCAVVPSPNMQDSPVPRSAGPSAIKSSIAVNATILDVFTPDTNINYPTTARLRSKKVYEPDAGITGRYPKPPWEYKDNCDAPDDSRYLDISRWPDKAHAKEKARAFCACHSSRILPGDIHIKSCCKGAKDHYCYNISISNLSHAAVQFDEEGCRRSTEWIIDHCPIGGTTAQDDTWPVLYW